MLCILIAGINGIPMGAKFLADDICPGRPGAFQRPL
jgi:hypothetical protein